MSIFKCSKAGYSTVSCEIPQKFELIQAFMVVLSTCKNEDPIKIEGARVLTTFLSLKSMGIFSYAQGQLTLQSLVESG